MPAALPHLDAETLEGMSAQELRELTTRLLARIESDAQTLVFKDARIDKLSAEIAQLRRLKFGVKSEKLDVEQGHLFEESVATDIAALEQELVELCESSGRPVPEVLRPKRAPLPAHLPRREIQHEPDSKVCTTPGCGCELKRIGEDVSEKLDYTPGVFTVERHVRGKWACAHCQRLVQAPVPAAVIDKGVPTPGLLAHVLVAKFADHRKRFAKSSCGEGTVVHADETPLAMLAPGTGKTRRAYLWAYAAGELGGLKAVVYDFAESRAGEHAREFLGHWRGSLVCDDFSGYKALFAKGVLEAGCMAHARRKFIELHQASKSELAATAVQYIGQLYGIEREVRPLTPEQRLAQRQARAAPLALQWHAWLQAQRLRVPDGGATAKAIDYSLRRWVALTRYLGDGALPIDNNHAERQIRPWATGRKNWLFAGTLLAGQRAAAVMSLVQSAKLNGLDPWRYLQDVLTRLPTHKASRVAELLPHRWQPQTG